MVSQDRCSLAVAAVSEFSIEVDYFLQIPPDDESKCTRKFVFSFSADRHVPKITVEFSSKGLNEKKVFTLKRAYRDDLFNNLPDDRRAKESLAWQIFNEYRKEMWLINDGILSTALSEVEKEVRNEKIKEYLESQRKRKNDAREFKERVSKLGVKEVPDGELVGPSSQEMVVDDDNLITEDSLWEKRFFD